MARYENVWRILTLRCEEASRLSSDSLDSILSSHDHLAWKLHLFLCRSCRRYHREIVAIRQLSRRLAESEVDQSAVLPDEARERIKRSLRGR